MPCRRCPPLFLLWSPLALFFRHLSLSGDGLSLQPLFFLCKGNRTQGVGGGSKKRAAVA